MRISCTRCGATLCEYSSHTIVVRHRKRLIVTTVDCVQALQCWRCGAVFDGERVRQLIANIEVANGEAKTKGKPTS